MTSARRLAALLLLALAALVVAGCGPRWTVIAQADPDPLAGATSFFIEPIHYDPPMVGSKAEAEYLAEKSADQRDSWLTDKSETSAKYAASLITAAPQLRFSVQPAPGIFIVRPIVSFIEPGFYAGIVGAPTQVQMRIQILASDGVLVDDIAVRSVIQPSMSNAASGTRMRTAGQDLGRVTADYLKKRTGVV